MDNRIMEQDVVTRLIKRCHESRKDAETLFDVVTKGSGRIVLAGEEVALGEDERAEFVERFSAEVEPTLWESKRRKDQI